jgi:hypothetical protein
MRIVVPLGLLLAVPVALLAFREGPAPNMAGGFGDGNCRTCHMENPLNAPGGRLTVETPPLYVPGRAYSVTITLTKAGLERGGFEIVARFASGPRKGKQAGAWNLRGDARLQVIKSTADPSLLFVQHTLAGTTTARTGTISWTFEWKAPVDTAPVQFNAAANATNDDNSPIGDYIYAVEKIARRQR